MDFICSTNEKECYKGEGMNKKKLSKAKFLYQSLINKRNISNIVFLTFFIVFFGGYAFFFTSELFFQNQANEQIYSDPQKVYNFGNENIRIIKWIWSREQQLMEIVLSIQSTRYDGIQSYSVEAVEKSNGNLQTDVLYEEPTFLVVHINSVPEKFTAVSFRLQTEGDDGAILKLYTNRYKVDQEKDIQVHDKQYYYDLQRKELVKQYQEEIKEFDIQIQDLENQIQEASTYVEKMEQEKQYQAADELKRTESLIREAQITISSCKEQIADIQKKIKNNKENIEALKEKIIEKEEP